MEFTPKHIKMCLDMAQNMREVYFHSFYNPNHTHISVNALLAIVRGNMNKNVTLSFLRAHHSGHHVQSFLHVGDDGSYHICLLSGMTNCWNRFALCKELFHVLLDEEAARNSSLSHHLADCRAALIDAEISGGESSKSELLTEFAAMQFLFPYAKRLKYAEEVEGRIAAGEQKKTIYEEVAKELRIPRVLTEEYLLKEYLDLFDPLSWIEKSDAR